MSRTTNIILIPDTRIDIMPALTQWLKSQNEINYTSVQNMVQSCNDILRAEGKPGRIEDAPSMNIVKPFHRVSDFAGGSRGFEATVYMAAYKYFDIPKFMRFLFNWYKENPAPYPFSSNGTLQVFIRDEDWEFFAGARIDKNGISGAPILIRNLI